MLILSLPQHKRTLNLKGHGRSFVHADPIWIFVAVACSTGRLSSKQASKQASKLASRRTSTPTIKQTNTQIHKHESKQQSEDQSHTQTHKQTTAIGRRVGPGPTIPAVAAVILVLRSFGSMQKGLLCGTTSSYWVAKSDALAPRARAGGVPLRAGAT